MSDLDLTNEKVVPEVANPGADPTSRPRTGIPIEIIYLPPAELRDHAQAATNPFGTAAEFSGVRTRTWAKN